MMDIIKSDNFVNALDDILDYMAKDELSYAIRFNRKLQKAINGISNFPYKSRESFYYSDGDVRDYIFKGYTIPYLVNSSTNQIIILDMFKWIDK